MTDATPNPLPDAPVVREVPAPTVPPPPTGLDELRAALTLQREADAMVAEALATKRSALERAETLVRDAQRAATRAEEDAAAAAAARVAAAREQAGRVLAEARVRADQIASDAEMEVTALRNDAADLRDSAQETIEAAELELHRARQEEEHRERLLHAALSEALHTVEHLDRVTGTLDDLLAQVRDEIATARRDLVQLRTDFGPEVPDGGTDGNGSVVLQWPHAQGGHDSDGSHEGADPVTPDDTEAISRSKHGRAERGSWRGFLRKARA